MFEPVTRRLRAFAAAAAFVALSGCTATTDTLGSDDVKTTAPSYEVRST